MSDPVPSPQPGPEVIREFADRGILWLMEDPGNLRDLLRVLEPTLADRLDVTRAVRVNRSFIPADLQKRESDLIFRMPLRLTAGTEEEIWLYLLMEHQSEPDPWLPFRLLEYMVELWSIQHREWADQGRQPADCRLHPIVPLVFYTGGATWREPLRLADRIDLAPELARFVPQWDTLFLNLHRTQPEQLTQLAGAVGWALRVQQAERAPLPDLEGVIREALAGLEGLSDAQRAQWLRVAWYLILLVFHRREFAEYRELQRLIVERARESKFRVREEVRTMGESMAQYIERTTREQVHRELAAELSEAEARGRRDEKTRSLTLLLEQRFGGLPPEVRRTLRTAGEEELDAWFLRAISAGSLEEVGIRGGA